MSQNTQPDSRDAAEKQAKDDKAADRKADTTQWGSTERENYDRIRNNP